MTRTKSTLRKPNSVARRANLSLGHCSYCQRRNALSDKDAVLITPDGDCHRLTMRVSASTRFPMLSHHASVPEPPYDAYIRQRENAPNELNEHGRRVVMELGCFEFKGNLYGDVIITGPHGASLLPRDVRYIRLLVRPRPVSDESSSSSNEESFE
jgi:hypothetical protein